MSRYGNLKTQPGNTVTPEDLACWNDLVAAATSAARGAPSASVPELKRVADAARNACAPGVVTRENPCVVLSKLARRYCAETTSGRREMQAELAEAADRAREALDAGDRRERKDIDG